MIIKKIDIKIYKNLTICFINDIYIKSPNKREGYKKMKQANNIKKAEKNLLIFIATFFSALKTIIHSFFKFLYKVCNQKITIMFIPHSEKKVFNFRINTFFLFMFIFLSISIIITFAVIGTISVNNIDDYNKVMDSKVSFQQKSLGYQNMIDEILESHSQFQFELDKLTNNLDSPILKTLQENFLHDMNQGGRKIQLNERNIVELTEYEKYEYSVQQLKNDYIYSKQAFSEIIRMSKKYNKLLKDLPFGSPVQGPYAITSGFGLRVHPIHKVLDMHQGLDLAYQLGTPIVSTAPGTVEKVEYSPFGYGWYCKISHEKGFSTLYAHMRSQPVLEPGDKVSKGTLIGYMGRTGATTGTHLHYEIRLGDNLLDPMEFVTIY